jgi:hypothetical protein
VQLLGQPHALYVTAEQASALEGQQAVARGGDDLVECGLDALAAVDRDRDERQVLRQREEPLGLEPVLDAEALGAAHHQADLEAAALEHVHQHV